MRWTGGGPYSRWGRKVKAPFVNPAFPARLIPNQKYSSIPISNSREIGIASQTPAMPNQTGRMKMQIGRARKESP